MPLIPYLALLPKGIIIQKFGDLFGDLEIKNGKAGFNQMSPGLKEWIDMLKRHHDDISRVQNLS